MITFWLFRLSQRNPSELLGGRIFGKALENMKQVFDYVIVDTPPLGSVIDAAVVAKQCDGTVMVIEGCLRVRQ